MTQEQIHTYFDNMLENQKARNFLNHLVRSYMPVSNITKVSEKPEGDFKCVITRNELISTQEILDGLETQEFKDNFTKSLKVIFDENVDKNTAVEQLIGDKQIAVTGKDTTTLLSYSVARELINWITNKALTGDKHINWLIGKINHSTLVKRGHKSNNEAVKAKAQRIEDKNDNRAKYQLGDANSALAALKAKLEGSEK